jgi:hypothetical protein
MKSDAVAANSDAAGAVQVPSPVARRWFTSTCFAPTRRRHPDGDGDGGDLR